MRVGDTTEDTAMTLISRRLASVIAVIVVTAGLSACGNDVTDTPSAAAPTLPEVQDDEEAALEAEIEANASADAATEAEASSSPTGPPTNNRGNIVKALGEEGAVMAEDGTPLFTFAIDSITPDATCTEEYSSYESENGNLTAVDMRVSTAPASLEELGYLTVSPGDFSFIGSDGLTFTNVDTIATYGCISDSEKFPSDALNPGSQYAGTVLLDLPETSGILIYQPSSVYSGGWEISY